jgi:hypothetical protein
MQSDSVDTNSNCFSISWGVTKLNLTAPVLAINMVVLYNNMSSRVFHQFEFLSLSVKVVSAISIHIDK